METLSHCTANPGEDLETRSPLAEGFSVAATHSPAVFSTTLSGRSTRLVQNLGKACLTYNLNPELESSFTADTSSSSERMPVRRTPVRRTPVRRTPVRRTPASVAVQRS